MSRFRYADLWLVVNDPRAIISEDHVHYWRMRAAMYKILAGQNGISSQRIRGYLDQARIADATADSIVSILATKMNGHKFSRGP